MPSQLLSLVDSRLFPDAAGWFEILVLALIFYLTIRFLQGTRGVQVLAGFVTVLIVLILFTNFFNLSTLTWLLQRFSVYLAIAFVVIFQPEIRRALAELGTGPLFTPAESGRNIAEPLVKAVAYLAERKIGALIAIEREMGIRSIEESGTPMDSLVSPEIITSIFFPLGPLHDGGIIIRGDRIVAAGCVFPLSSKEELNKTLGTRHRAALGLTEETDALVIVVSEETGTISIASRGKLRRGYDEDKIRRVLNGFYGKGKKRAFSLRKKPAGDAGVDAPGWTENPNG